MAGTEVQCAGKSLFSPLDELPTLLCSRPVSVGILASGSQWGAMAGEETGQVERGGSQVSPCEVTAAWLCSFVPLTYTHSSCQVTLQDSLDSGDFLLLPAER